ncbi:MAG: glycoside hydrolase family 113 [Thermoanaerobaculia bacterium]
MARLAAELDRAVAGMAPRVPLKQAAPVSVRVVADFVAQGREAGEIGEAVRGRDADLLLVYNSNDGPAYRYALAGVLRDRAGLDGLPPALARGAALWLSRDWYGKPYREWLPLLVAARVLPEAEEILAAQEPADFSSLLETPAIAAVIDRLPGTTLAEKLSRPPDAGRIAAILAALRASTPGPARSKAAVAPRRGFLKGVSLAMQNSLEGGYHAPALAGRLDLLAGLGVTSVSLMPFAFQPGPDRPELRFLNRGARSETDIGLIHAARLARARGFRVLYKPHIWVSHASWPGEIAMKSEADWARWWRAYRRYALHHAFLARWAGADVFCAGVELSKTIGRDAEWRDLIASIRLFFPGPVTYASNWYQDLESVRFWDRLDYIGVDAYFPLAPSAEARPGDLKRGAEEIARRLRDASRRFGRPVLLTEVGFAARRGAWVEPHVEGGDYSEDDQALAYRALFAALGRPSWLAGTFLWKVFSAPGSDDGPRPDFRFLGRKAEGAVRNYYGF